MDLVMHQDGVIQLTLFHISVTTVGLFHVYCWGGWRLSKGYVGTTVLKELFPEAQIASGHFPAAHIWVWVHTWGKGVKLILLSLFPFQLPFSYLKKNKECLAYIYYAPGVQTGTLQFDILVSARSPLIKAS